jgi:hypothetical protein
MQGDELCSLPATVRKELHNQLKQRLINQEREGHMEDLLIATILDPRYYAFDQPVLMLYCLLSFGP